MLRAIGVASLDALIDEALAMKPPLSERHQTDLKTMREDVQRSLAGSEGNAPPQ